MSAKLVDWDAVEAYYNDGHGFVACGKHFGLNWQTVRNHLKARGVQFRPSPAKEYWAKREVVREVEVEVVKEVIVEVPQPQPEAPPTPKRRIIGINTKYEGK